MCLLRTHHRSLLQYFVFEKCTQDFIRKVLLCGVPDLPLLMLMLMFVRALDWLQVVYSLSVRRSSGSISRFLEASW